MATANDLTRQQLDELDALLQRMLTVPAAKEEAMPPPATALTEPPSGWRIDPPAPAAVPHQIPSFADEPFTPSPMLALERPVFAEVPASAGAASHPTEDRLKPELQHKPFSSFAEVPTETFAPLVAPEAPIPDDDSALSPLLWPLAAVNWILEGTLKLFGPPGEMLTGRTGKNLLGTAGLCMMIGAGLWAAQGQGWVKLPIEKVLNR